MYNVKENSFSELGNMQDNKFIQVMSFLLLSMSDIVYILFKAFDFTTNIQNINTPVINLIWNPQ